MTYPDERSYKRVWSFHTCRHDGSHSLGIYLSLHLTFSIYLPCTSPSPNRDLPALLSSFTQIRKVRQNWWWVHWQGNDDLWEQMSFHPQYPNTTFTRRKKRTHHKYASGPTASLSLSVLFQTKRAEQTRTGWYGWVGGDGHVLKRNQSARVRATTDGPHVDHPCVSYTLWKWKVGVRTRFHLWCLFKGIYFEFLCVWKRHREWWCAFDSFYIHFKKPRWKRWYRFTKMQRTN